VCWSSIWQPTVEATNIVSRKMLGVAPEDAASIGILQMPSPSPRISVVLPVRNGEHSIESRVIQILEAMSDLTRGATEVVVVDDGSKDSTPEVLSELKARYPQVRIVRHSRPRGLEAAGQTGLERSTGDLVFIQETNATVRIEDMRRLLRMSEDKSVVAARAESTPRPLSGALVRRLRAFGTHAAQSLESASETPAKKTSIQMIRRPHLQKLVSQRGNHYRLNGETVHSTSLESA
jgi:cellulose synthase/poly-beta-1,6-N-acetylglucosamine synthase-like glycosyltransferase